MKKLIIILFAVSIYLPEAIQIVDLSKCIITVVNTNKGEFCDCFTSSVFNTTSIQKNVTPFENKFIAIQQIDKLYNENEIDILFSDYYPNIKYTLSDITFLSNKHLQEVFHPPLQF